MAVIVRTMFGSGVDSSDRARVTEALELCIGHMFQKVMTDALHVGPILLGAAKPAHILTPSVTSRGVVNMSAYACVEAQAFEASGEQ